MFRNLIAVWMYCCFKLRQTVVWNFWQARLFSVFIAKFDRIHFGRIETLQLLFDDECAFVFVLHLYCERCWNFFFLRSCRIDWHLSHLCHRNSNFFFLCVRRCRFESPASWLLRFCDTPLLRAWSLLWRIFQLKSASTKTNESIFYVRVCVCACVMRVCACTYLRTCSVLGK